MHSIKQSLCTKQHSRINMYQSPCKTGILENRNVFKTQFAKVYTRSNTLLCDRSKIGKLLYTLRRMISHLPFYQIHLTATMIFFKDNGV